jgi:hypothetical protein
MEALRALKRRLSNIVYKTMLDARSPTPRPVEDAPGRATGKRL